MSRGPYTDAELGIDPVAEQRAEDRANDAMDRFERGERDPCPDCCDRGCPRCWDTFDEESE